MEKDELAQCLSSIEKLTDIHSTLIRGLSAIDADPPSVILVGYMWCGESIDSMHDLLSKYKVRVSEDDYNVAVTIFQLKSREFHVDSGKPTEQAIAHALQWADTHPVSKNPLVDKANTEDLKLFIQESVDRINRKRSAHPH